MTFAQLPIAKKSIRLLDYITGEDLTVEYLGADFGEEMDAYLNAIVDATEDCGDYIAVYIAI